MDEDVELKQEDFDAADEVMKRYSVDEKYAEHSRELLAKLHSHFGRSKFRLYYGLRKPRGRIEEWKVLSHHGKITLDEFRELVKNHALRPIDQEMIDELFPQIEQQIKQYSLGLQAVSDSIQPGRGIRHRRKLEQTATKHFARTRGKFTLTTEELNTVAEFLDQVRLQLNLGNAHILDYSGTNAFFLISNLFKLNLALWKKYLEIAHKSQTQPQYLYATTAGQMLLNPKSGNRPPFPQNLLTLLWQEKTAATHVLRQREQDQMNVKTAPSNVSSLEAATFKIQTAQIDIASLQSQVESAKKQKKDVLLEVKHWSELAIGIDERSRFLAIIPAPGFGEQFKKTKAVELPIGIGNTRIALVAFAEALTHGQVPMTEMLRKLNRLPVPATRVKNPRARKPESTSELSSSGSTNNAALSVILKEVGRELRKHVGGPTRKGNSSFWSKDGCAYCGFKIAHLLSNPDGTFRFGKPPRTTDS